MQHVVKVEAEDFDNAKFVAAAIEAERPGVGLSTSDGVRHLLRLGWVAWNRERDRLRGTTEAGRIGGDTDPVGEP